MKKGVVSRVSGPAAGTCTFFSTLPFGTTAAFFYHVVWPRPMFADVVVWYKAIGRKSGSFHLGYITPPLPTSCPLSHHHLFLDF